MTEESANLPNRRRPWVAVVFSLVMPGLGHAYCGRLPRGLVFLFVYFVPILLLQAARAFESFGSAITGVIVLITAAPLMHLAATIDSYYVARGTRRDYEMKDYNRWYVYVVLVLLNSASSLNATLSLRANYLEAFRVPTVSNYPTIAPGDRFLANKIAYNNSDPKRGDLVVFINPQDRAENYIKRVVAVAGDTVEIRGGALYINDRKVPRHPVAEFKQDGTGMGLNCEPVEGEVLCEVNGNAQYRIFLSAPPHDQESGDFAKITVPQHHCFVLGDNRNLSRDSRHFGPVPLSTIKGRAEYLYWPAKGWSRFGSLTN
ncbi:MAG: signal peptidase I [Phycisphaerales bacterium]|nr:MAG: signal peptidase I [Phycisphaerales bacterium]